MARTIYDMDYKSNITVSLSYYDRTLLEGIAQSLRVIESDIAGYLRPQLLPEDEPDAT